MTEELVAAGADVVGVDASAEMIAQAKARGLDARLANACELDFSREFDVVFSNSVLHWIREPERVIDSVARALKPGGRFVGEFGGHGCCGAGVVAIAAVLAGRGIDIGQVNPWYYPTAREYRLRLEAGGFAVGLRRTRAAADAAADRDDGVPRDLLRGVFSAAARQRSSRGDG